MKILAAILCLICGNAFAMTGNELLKKLQSPDPIAILEGHAYIRGVLDSESVFLARAKFAMGASGSKKLASEFFCIPTGGTVGGTSAKLSGPITAKLIAEPNTRSQTANVLIRRALIESYPCPEN